MTHFWCEIESQVTVRRQLVLHEQGYLAGQAQFYGGGQPARFAKVDQVFEGEGQGDRLRQSDLHIQLGLLDVGVGPKCDCTIADVA